MGIDKARQDHQAAGVDHVRARVRPQRRLDGDDSSRDDGDVTSGRSAGQQRRATADDERRGAGRVRHRTRSAAQWHRSHGRRRAASRASRTRRPGGRCAPRRRRSRSSGCRARRPYRSRWCRTSSGVGRGVEPDGEIAAPAAGRRAGLIGPPGAPRTPRRIEVGARPAGELAVGRPHLDRRGCSAQSAPRPRGAPASRARQRGAASRRGRNRQSKRARAAPGTVETDG